MKQYSIAVVGATGLVGTTLLSLLAERKFPIDRLCLVASQQSIGRNILFKDKIYTINDLSTFDFSQTQIAFFCVGNELASEYIPKATKAGNVVIDKSHFFRNHRDVPLIIPEVNLQTLSYYRKMKIIASPNCNTIPIAVAVKPIYDACGIRRINVSTYQSVSGAGKEAMNELTEQTKQHLANTPITTKINERQIAFNVLPHIDEFETNGYTREEMKIVWEMQKIFNDRMIAVNPTAVRVPVYCGHAASIHLETYDKLPITQALELLAKGAGIKLMTGDKIYPTPAQDVVGQDCVYVGRVREDISHETGLNLWVVTDNLRKGAALNAVQIAENLIKDHL